ncbi:hypothetical protein ACFXDH_23130 [Streptomyces sp. NPDC059467]|uniref:hypothetical protein n=1 Tax=Streptomyces sp. NPDC059467 TaxID=3346844 RepID=UPI0036B89A44
MSDDTARPYDPEEPRGRGGHCVVLGASIAGLFAARVLSDTFDRVTLVDRDELPAPDENRRGVPQGRHAHAILPAGTRGLQEMFYPTPSRGWPSSAARSWSTVTRPSPAPTATPSTV